MYYHLLRLARSSSYMSGYRYSVEKHALHCAALKVLWRHVIWRNRQWVIEVAELYEMHIRWCSIAFMYTPRC